ncbi:AAA family ATPase [Psychromonas sp. KJ10-2]|uniref:AAA family ATPase n=1 Tax=Psychromonas sp. KJ10-2 TaxID=3391822 RepID=UPI0039B5F6EC
MTNNISPVTLDNASSTTQLELEKTTPLSISQCTPAFTGYIEQYVAPSELAFSPLFTNATAIIEKYLKLPVPLLLVNSRYWLNAQQVLKEVIPNDLPVDYLLSYNQESLFGRASLNADDTLHLSQGLLNTFNNGALVLNISPLLVESNLWFKLKSVLQRGYLLASDAVNADKSKQALPDLQSQPINIKLILVANRAQLEELIQIDPEYTQISSLFCELASQVPVNQTSINTVIHYCQHLAAQLGLTPLNDKALQIILNALSIECQHQQQLLFDLEFIEQTIRYANLFTQNNSVTEDDLSAYFDEINEAQSLARKYSEQSVIEGQVNLQLTGEKIGQINGLSVVELLGYPCEFGEVFRISASDMIGDGEIIDVERKVELAGNIHAKSTHIVQGYLNHFFSHISAFPYSCNLVFEQSYQESDGDSASLAILLAVSSCYAKCAVKQDVFVTGSLDQHGNVLPIGGINQKIESVSRLFELGLLTDPVTIVMPKANMLNLTLNKYSLALIEEGKLLIHAINHCHQAFPILLNKSFEQIIKTINCRIELANKEEMEESSIGLFSRLKHSIFH